MVCAMLASRAGVVDVGEGAGWATALLHNVICFFAATVAQAGSDASFWCCASVVRGVVFDFLCHDGLLLLLLEGVTISVRTWVAGIGAGLALRSGSVDGAPSAWSALADIQGHGISKRDRLEVAIVVQRFASVTT
jgi:hypothetical protein